MSAAPDGRYADAGEIGRFVDAMFRYADEGTFVSLRAFDQFKRDVPPYFITSVLIGEDLSILKEIATRAALRSAESPTPTVFAPPIATFSNGNRARGVDLANGLALSVEIDDNPHVGRDKLEQVLGPVTLAVESGSFWVDPETGEMQPKLHLHWRLSEATRDQRDHDRLHMARDLAAQLIGADPTGKPVVHPLRWPGSWNTKSTPRLARIVADNQAVEITLVDALALLEEAAGLTIDADISGAGGGAANGRHSAEPDADTELVIDALAHIPNTGKVVHYDEWIRLGYAVWRATGGSDAAFDIWDAWSKRSDKYDATETDLAWCRICSAISGTNPARRIGAGTIFWKAAEHGWVRPQRSSEYDGEGQTDGAEAATGKRKRERPKRSARTDSGLPLIRVVAGQLHTVTTAAESALIASGLPIYQRGDGLVQPIVREVTASRGRMTLAAGLGELNVHSAIDRLCAVADWERYDARCEDWVRVNPPQQVAQILLARHGRWAFPVIAGVITTPTIRADGSLLTDAGYDAATRLYHVADPALKLDPVVHAPARDDAEKALNLLLGLLEEFPFVVIEKENQAPREVSKSVALSMLITPVVRGALSVAPAHAARANTAGSGKSYLADTASAIATGRPCPVISAAPDEAETEKRIAGLLLAGFPLINIDNVNGELGGDLLCQAIERPLIRIRRLGASDIIEIESCATIFATGNQMRVKGDMVRRTLVCDLDAKMERPELRAFKADPVKTVLTDRGSYVSACLIIVRAYLLAGKAGCLPHIASFDGWSDLVRSALVWLGCADPAESMEQARQDDPELGDLSEMIDAWRAAFGNGEMTCRAVIDNATAKKPLYDRNGDAIPNSVSSTLFHPALHDILLRLAAVRGVIDPARLGRWLLSREGRIVGRERFKRAGATGGAARWKLDTPRREVG